VQAAPAVQAAAEPLVVRIEHGPSRDRRFAYAMGAAVVVAFAAVAVVAMTRDNKDDAKNDEGVVARRRLPTTEPAATTAPPAPSASAAEPEEITVEIRVTPAAARIFVDGVKAANNPHRVKVARGKFMHEIRAEAEGFVPYATNVAFDRDRTLDVALPPKPFGGSGPAKKPAEKGDNPY
jgi:serine/threonine-protein kinase